MRDESLPEFSALLDATCAMLSRGAYQPNPTSTALFFRALSSYSIETVKTAMSKHIADPQRGRFVPTPADVIAQICGSAAEDGRPGPEEAWALVLRGQDEAETLVWSDEMAVAWGTAKTVLDAGDEVGARMAFRETYTRHVDAARSQRIPVRWSASLGHDAARREEALQAAAALGRVPHNPQLALPGAEPAALLAGPEAGMSPAKAAAIEKLRAIGGQPVNPTAWADELQARANRGEELSPAQREALATYEAGMSSGARAAGFTSPPTDTLPPAMRPYLEEFN